MPEQKAELLWSKPAGDSSLEGTGKLFSEECSIIAMGNLQVHVVCVLYSILP